MTSKRDKRLAEIEAELRPVYQRLSELTAERARLKTEAARERWPNGPFTLRYYRHHSPYDDKYDEPLEAVRAAEGMEDYGDAATQCIEDRHGHMIYDLTGYPPERVDDSYPEIPRFDD
mgnify:CR=1 FL=1